MLPEHLLLYLNERIFCREAQIRQLAGALDPEIPSPPTIIVHGTHATGKSLTVSKLLPALGVPHAIVQCRECITGRHLLERIVLAVKTEAEKTGTEAFNNIDGRCESLSALAVLLQRMLEQVKKFVLILDGIDRQREAPPTLLPGIARLGEIIPSLTTLLVTTYSSPRSLHIAGIPHIHFPAFDRAQTLFIVSRDPLDIFASETVAAMHPDRRLETEEDNPWLWSRFVGAVWEALGKGAARDVVSLRKVCKRLWLPFVAHIRDGTYGTRDFSRLMVRTRALFQGEGGLSQGLVKSAAPAVAAVGGAEGRKRSAKASHDLSYHTAHLLIAAYLASHNPARSDTTFFTKHSDRKKKRRKAPTTTPQKAQKHRKIARRLLGPQPFDLERLLAIFHAIVPDGAPAGSADVLTQVATLVGLRMVVKAGAGGGGGGLGGSAGGLGVEVLEGGGRFRCNVGWEYVSAVARRVGCEVAEYVAE